MVFKQGRFVLVVTITLSQQAAHVMMISVVQTCMVIGERILVSFSYDASYIISKLLFLFFYSATQSGLLLVPVDDNGVPVQGILHGSLWYHGTEAATCSIPSENSTVSSLLGDLVRIYYQLYCLLAMVPLDSLRMFGFSMRVSKLLPRPV